MTDAQWQSVWKLYQSSKSVAPDQLAAFLNSAAEDPEVRAEVLSMLQGSGTAGALDRVGQKIGRYVLTSRLGEGGMGEVFAARDSELGRMVAVKLLASSATGDAVARFIQEAKAASALNHPNIITIYEVIHSSSRVAIVMELVDGMPLRQLCGAPLPVDRVLHIGEQIARALAAAHARGIVHCDLKPENLMVRPDGIVKVLDFGLAQDLSSAPSRSVLPAGTLRYMSPEQSCGETASAASDIFSLGIVLYELASGVHPFERGSIFDTLKALNEASPAAPSSRNTFVPPQLDKVILRMLARDSGQRPGAAEVAQAFESGFRHPIREVGPPPADIKPAKSRAPWWAAVPLLAAAAGGIWWGTSSRPDVAFEPLPLTALPGSEEGPSFSPDGSQVAFRGNQAGVWDVYVKLLGGGPPLRLTSDAGTHWYPAWSPDGKSIAFTARHDDGRNGLFVMPALGGPERLLADLNGEWTLSDWSADGQWIAVSPSSAANLDRSLGVTLISTQTGERRELLKQAPELAESAGGRFAPDGRRLVFLKMRGAFGQLYVANLSDSMMLAERPRQVVPDDAQSPAWTADSNEIIFMRGFSSSNGALARVPANGGSIRKISGLGYTAGPIGIARKGGRMAFSRGGIDFDIWRLDTRGEEAPRKWVASTLFDTAGEYSPDGKRIAFSSNRSGPREIWVCNADGSSAAQLTHFGGPITGTARWSPDGRWIVFDSRPRGNPDVFVISAEGTGLRRLTDRPGSDEKTNRHGMFQPSWSADGKWIYYSTDTSGRFEVWRMPWTGGPAEQVTKNGGSSAYPDRNGEWIYYLSGLTGPLRRIRSDGSGDGIVVDSEIALLQYSAIPGGVYFVSSSDGKSVLQRLSPDGKILNVLDLPFKPGLGLSLSPDGRHVLLTRPDENGTDLMLVEGFQ
jgi:Tol biopolymer transport system component/serine/threonine protein kinase